METIDIFSRDADRRSHFRIEGNKLVVSGNLPHGYKFEPYCILDAENLIQWLKQWNEARKRELENNE